MPTEAEVTARLYPSGQTTNAQADSWPAIDEAAYCGLAGAFVNAVEPFSEADPVGILLHILVAGGCVIGTNPHMLVERSAHCARLNVLFAGDTATGRKGTSWSVPRYVLSKVDEDWVKTRIRSGLSSGEGLIYNVRDADGDDPGEPDKRLLVIEPEFASAFMAMERQGNTLSPKIREAWDHGNMAPMTKRDRLTATQAHICIVGHITPEELTRSLTATERANGFANRFLFALVKQSKFISSGKGVPDSVLEPFFTRFSRTMESARKRGELTRDAETEALWDTVYRELAQEPPGLTAAIVSRGAAQVLRLSLVYSLLDETEAERSDPAVRVVHLLAALAIWDYSKTSVRYIFGDAIGDAVADRLLRLINTGPQTDTDLYNALGRHDGTRKDIALDHLLKLNRVHAVKVPTSGRPIREWHIGIQGMCALCAKSV